MVKYCLAAELAKVAKEDNHILRPTHKAADQEFAWVVCLSSFLTMFIITGIHQAYGCVSMMIMNDLGLSQSDGALLGSLSFGLGLFLGPLAGIFIEFTSHRTSNMVGGLLAATGLFISSYLCEYSELYWSYVILFGVGTSLSITACTCIIGIYFTRYVSFASGLVASGSSFGGVCMSFLAKMLAPQGWQTTLYYYSILCLMIVPISYPLRKEKLCHELYPGELPDEKRPTVFDDIRKRCRILKTKAFVLWALITSFISLSSYLPYVFMLDVAGEIGTEPCYGPNFIMVLAGFSGCSRIFFGIIADIYRPYRPKMLFIATLVMAFSFLVIPIVRTCDLLFICCMIYGFTEGALVMLMPVLTFDMFGPENSPLIFGFIMGINSLFIVAGPILTNFLKSVTGKYIIPFHGAAVFQLISAVGCMLLPNYLPPYKLDYVGGA